MEDIPEVVDVCAAHGLGRGEEVVGLEEDGTGKGRTVAVEGCGRGVLHYEMRVREVPREPDTHVAAAPADVEYRGRGILTPRESIEDELEIDLERQRLHRTVPSPCSLQVMRQLIIEPQRGIVS